MQVLLVSDNASITSHFLEFSRSLPNIVLLQASNTKYALDIWTEKRPCLTIFDVDVPKNDPLFFILSLASQEDIRNSTRYFLFLSGLDPDDIARTKMSLQEVGSGNFLLKGLTENSFGKESDELFPMIKNIYERLEKTFPPSESLSNKHPDLPQDLLNNASFILEKIQSNPVEIIAIGVSTGGPFALRKLFSNVHKISCPIVIVQHMPVGFIQGFVSDLRKIFSLPFEIAKQGEILENKIYFAPDNSHLHIERIENRLTVLLGHSSPIKGFLPSIEVLFESLVSEKIRCLGILMSGIGNDGVDNLSLLHRNGNPVITQTPEDAIAYGMPSSLIQKKAVDGILSLAMIGQVIENLGEIQESSPRIT